MALLATVFGGALASAFACNGSAIDIHETSTVKSKLCIDCHSGAYNAAASPPHLNKMPTTCESCHVTSGWVPATTKDHPWWPIQNKHVGVGCTSCHTKGFAAGDTPKDCASCHKKDYDSAKEPKHTGFPTTCETCHSDLGFKPSTYKHEWPLEGKHAATACTNCHTGDPVVFKGTPTACQSCHQKDADQAANPIHVGLPATCADCHSPIGWKPSSYVHTWPLQGKHVLVRCNDCHTGSPPKYKGTATDCYACHKAQADASTYPGHATFPHTCLDCHAMAGWKPAVGGLHPEAKFPLKTGKHVDPAIHCQDCHILARGVSAGGQNTDCVHCHLGDHTRPDIDTKHIDLKVPNYPVASTSPNDCLTCHPAGTK